MTTEAPPPHSTVHRTAVIRAEDIDRYVRVLQRYVLRQRRFWTQAVTVFLALVVILAAVVVVAHLEGAEPSSAVSSPWFTAALLPIVALASVLAVRKEWGRVFRRLLTAHGPPRTSVGVWVGGDELAVTTQDAVHRLRTTAVTRATWVDDLLVVETGTDMLYLVRGDLLGADGWSLLEAHLRCRVRRI
ncbi:MAG: hypothetical protein ACRCSN_05230 [Dermatophilaceae bacterium]